MAPYSGCFHTSGVQQWSSIFQHWISGSNPLHHHRYQDALPFLEFEIWNCPHHISPVYILQEALPFLELEFETALMTFLLLQKALHSWCWKVDCIQEFEYFKILNISPPPHYCISPFRIGNWSRFLYSLRELFGAVAV